MPTTRRLVASAPGRVDIAGRVDLPEVFGRFPLGSLGTCNIAISIRTSIAFHADPSDEIVLRAPGFEERRQRDQFVERSDLPYFWLAARAFGIPCGTYQVFTDIPRGSGLGGSSAFVVALRSLVAAATGMGPTTDVGRAALILEAFQFENGTGMTSAGFQDYLSAVYGGLNHWSSGLGADGELPVAARWDMWRPDPTDSFDGSIVVAFTGEPHSSNRLGSARVTFSEGDRQRWLEVGDLCLACARLLHERRWRELAVLMSKERELWVRVSGERMSSRVRRLLDVADGCGVGFAIRRRPIGGQRMGHRRTGGCS